MLPSTSSTGHRWKSRNSACPNPTYEDIPEGWIERYPGGWERRERYFVDCGDPCCGVCRWSDID